MILVLELVFKAFLLTGLALLSLGTIAKCKALMQNRFGPPLLQPLYDILKLLRKGETVSVSATFLFRAGAYLCCSIALVLMVASPLLPVLGHFLDLDLFLFVYLMALNRFLTILASLDTGAPFAAFASSRELTLSALTEPAIVLALCALGLLAKSSNLGAIFAYSVAQSPAAASLSQTLSSASSLTSSASATALLSPSPEQLPVWIAAGFGLFLACLVELSRMPIDDPNTHLELTMVHEAMTLENSGINLAMVQLAYGFRIVVLFGLVAQCLIHAITSIVFLEQWAVTLLFPVFVLTFCVLTAVIESFWVKLDWRKNPHFIAYSLTFSMLAFFGALLWSKS